MHRFSIANDYSRLTGARDQSDGHQSGQHFAETKLFPLFFGAMRSGFTVEINLDGTEGMASSFLDASFGELARELLERKLDKNLIYRHFTFTALIDRQYLEKVREKIDNATLPRKWNNPTSNY